MPERRPNRLLREPSPYLQQHAHNPVDWYPWGSEALQKAKAEDKPILLSIGYSACHWCHVMERESFEDEAIARKMNELFVPIKVDREERPDLDHLYQLAVQLMGRSGGWPLTVFLTPDQHAFFGGTYFPPVDRYGMPGFGDLLEMIAQAYRADRPAVESRARDLTGTLATMRSAERAQAPRYTLASDLLEKAAETLSSQFDDRHGGFGIRPKFPNTMCLELLLRRGIEEDDERASARVRMTLDAMRSGGIWDHLGGGFHRYSTDERWLIPHFEKMLYDNALLLRLYTNGLRAFGDEAYAETASDIGTYLLREMQSDRGGFYATQDADSESEEGRYFVWGDAEVRSLFEDDAVAADIVRHHFGITPAGNFESTGKTVLAESTPLFAVAETLGRPVAEIREILDRAMTRMLAEREKRIRPARDEKILAGWNGLVIRSLADASAALHEPALLAAAEQAFTHVERTLMVGGRAQRLVKSGAVRGPGFLDDHAFLCMAALELYEVTGNPARLATAIALADQILAHHWSEQDGTFYLSPNDAPTLVVRPEDSCDQAIPSGASMASLALLKLGVMVDDAYTHPARQYLEAIASAATADPFGYAHTIGVLDRLVRGSTDIVLSGSLSDPRTRALYNAIFSNYIANRNVVLVDPDQHATLRAAHRLTEGKRFTGMPVAYVCRERTCSAPLYTPEQMTEALL